MELTKEYLDKGLERLHERMDELVTKEHLDQRLAEQTEKLESYSREAFETQQIYIEARADEIMKMLDVRLAVQDLQLEMSKVKAAIHLK
jgi:hypothetical protein